MRIAFSFLFSLFVIPTFALSAQDATGEVPAERLKEIFDGGEPKTVAELKAMEAHVKKLLEKIVPCTVGLRVGANAGSGVIITEDGYILTAGHVSGRPKRTAAAILPDGKTLPAKTLGANNGIDSGLMQITKKGEYPYLEMGESSKLKKGQWIIALGHPGGYVPGRRPPLRLGRIQYISERYIRTDCLLVGGDSGGPLIDMDGKVIGIHSRINRSLSTNIHVPVDTYGETWDRLVKGDQWGGASSRRGGPYLGIQIKEDTDAKQVLIESVTKDGPADKAGIQSNDILLSIDGQTIQSRQSLRIAMAKKSIGDKIKVKVKRGDAVIENDLTIGRRR